MCYNILLFFGAAWLQFTFILQNNRSETVTWEYEI